MITGGEAALIGAAGLVAGAAVTGTVQVLLASRQREHDRQDQRRATKRELYDTYLRRVANVPMDLWSAIIRSDDKFYLDFAQMRNDMRIGILLDASPEVAKQMEALFESVRQWASEYQRRYGPGSEMPEGLTVQGILNELFDEIVLPQMQATGDAMAEELGSR
jgi:hypothetical protein